MTPRGPGRLSGWRPHRDGPAGNAVGRPGAPPRPGRVVVMAVAATVVAAAPVFLVGAQSVQIGASLRMGPGMLGLTEAAFFGATALSTSALGRVVQRQGPRRSLTWAVPVNVAAALYISFARSAVEIGAGLLLAGVANGAVHPSANALLATRAWPGRLGLSLGAKQSAPTMASLLAGVAVPVIALTVGWRWSFVALAAAGAFFLWRVRRLPDTDSRASPRSPAPRPRSPGTAAAPTSSWLWWLAVVAALGACAGNSLTMFAVDYAVHVAGLAPGVAGAAYAVASLAGLLGRLLGGGWMDREGNAGPLRVTLGLLAVAAVSDLTMSSGFRFLFVPGLIAAYGLGWAWPALLHYAAVARDAAGAATATGILMTGFATGSFLGPLLLGQIVSAAGYRYLWVTAAGFNALAVAILFPRSASWEPGRGSRRPGGRGSLA